MIYSVEFTEHHQVIQRLVEIKIPDAKICKIKNKIDLIKIIYKIKKGECLMVNTMKHDLNLAIVMIFAIIKKYELIVGIHCANQFLLKDYIKFNEYTKNSTKTILSLIKYLLFISVNFVYGKAIRMNFEVTGYGKDINKYLESGGARLSSISEKFNEDTECYINLDEIKIENELKLILYGRLDSQRIDESKYLKLIKFVTQNNKIKLTILSEDMNDKLKKLKKLNNIKIKIKPKYNYEYLENAILKNDFIININKNEKFRRAMNYEEYGSTMLSGSVIDSIITGKKIINV